MALLILATVALSGCARLVAPRGTWTGTAVFAGVSGGADPDCRPNWGENVGDTKEVLLSFANVRSTGEVHLAVPRDFIADWYQLSVRPFAREVTLERLKGEGRGATRDADCDLTLMDEVVTGQLRDGRFSAEMTQQWKNAGGDGEQVTVRYNVELQQGAVGAGSPMAGVWAGTPRLQSVESDNQCIAQAHDRWGHRENPATLWIRGESAGLRADMLDFTAHDDCHYSGRVSDDGTFAFTSGDGSCGGGTGVDECAPGTGFQMRSKTIEGVLSGAQITGRMVETWSLHEAPHTPIVVTYHFSFQRAAER